MSNVGWDDVTVLRKKADRAVTARSAADINAARRAGAVVSTDKKIGTGNKHSGSDHQHLAKIDRENEVAPPPKIDISVGRAIQKARQEKNLTQKDLAQRINEKANIINDYEMGRAIPNNQILGKLERILGVKLRGKNIGEPFGSK
ncbi:uncharacterized protein VTP21DRAFT_1746 [Calcarisporiella thermophila]|uniref:uncharacterized protein n=1 Tax=Calcarisporiella thermophila TaxID=911321 RepID=UPI0037431D0F